MLGLNLFFDDELSFLFLVIRKSIIDQAAMWFNLFYFFLVQNPQMQLSLELIMLELNFKNWHIQHILVHLFSTMHNAVYSFLFSAAVLDLPRNQKQESFSPCSMLISGSSQLNLKGMLLIAVYVKLAQTYCQFQVTIRLGIKNRS